MHIPLQHFLEKFVGYLPPLLFIVVETIEPLRKRTSFWGRIYVLFSFSGSHIGGCDEGLGMLHVRQLLVNRLLFDNFFDVKKRLHQSLGHWLPINVLLKAKSI